jgi:hypothetical protein
MMRLDERRLNYLSDLAIYVKSSSPPGVLYLDTVLLNQSLPKGKGDLTQRRKAIIECSGQADTTTGYERSVGLIGPSPSETGERKLPIKSISKLRHIIYNPI